ADDEKSRAGGGPSPHPREQHLAGRDPDAHQYLGLEHAGSLCGPDAARPLQADRRARGRRQGRGISRFRRFGLHYRHEHVRRRRNDPLSRVRFRRLTRVRAPRLTLLGAFVAALALVAALLAALAVLVLESSRRSILASAEKLRDAAARRVETQVRAQLDGASSAISDVEREIMLGVVRPHDLASVEGALFRQVARNPALAEVTLLHAHRTGYDAEGNPTLAPAGRWQLSVFRSGIHG